MRGLTSLFATLVLVATVLPALAQEHEQSIFQVRSRDVGNAPPELIALCNEKALEVPIPGLVFQVSPLNAEFWALQTRSTDGLVINEFVRQVGAAAACSFVVVTEDGIRIALYGDSEVSGFTFEGWGECEFPIQELPTPASQVGTCNMVLEPDPEQGIARGMATSNSVSGDATGSFWTFRIIWE